MYGALLLLAAALAFGPDDARLAYESARSLVSDFTPRDGGTDGSRRAAERIRALARTAGATNAALDSFSAATPRGRRTFTNVTASFGRTDGPWVVFLSHFDTKPGVACPGANDGAATSGLLVALCRVLAADRVRDLPLGVALVWTDGEECFERYGPQDGLWGSRHAAGVWRRANRRVAGVICFDMLGDRDLAACVPANGTPALVCAARAAARESGFPLVPSSFGVTDDHVPFLKAGFPAIDVIDFDYGSVPGRNDWWHTADDTLDKVSEASLLASGRFAVRLLLALGHGNCYNSTKGGRVSADGRPREGN